MPGGKGIACVIASGHHRMNPFCPAAAELSLPIRCLHPWAQCSSQHGPSHHIIIKTSGSFQCLLRSHCDENGFYRSGEAVKAGSPLVSWSAAFGVPSLSC